MFRSQISRSLSVFAALLLGGIAVSAAQAATVSQTQEFFMTAPTGASPTLALGFDLFNPALGTLTGVSFDLDSAVRRTNDETVTASLSIAGNTLASYSTADFFVDENFDFAGSGLIGPLTLVDYTGPGVFDVDATLANPGGFGTVGSWDGATIVGVNNLAQYSGLTLTYTYDIPEPASLSLLALGGLALIRRRRLA